MGVGGMFAKMVATAKSSASELFAVMPDGSNATVRSLGGAVQPRSRDTTVCADGNDSMHECMLQLLCHKMLQHAGGCAPHPHCAGACCAAVAASC